MKRRRFLQVAALPTLSMIMWPSAAALACQAAAQDAGDELSGPARGPWRRLFLDGAVIEQQKGLERVFHQATSFDANPIIQADQSWEGKSAITGPYVYGTVLREGERFRLWYQVLYQGNHVGYAESKDGVQWTKPQLDIVPFENETKTNLVVSALSPEKFSGVQCHNPSVMARPQDPNPARRYALYGFDGASRGPRVAFSSDGLQFEYPRLAGEDPHTPLFDSSDVVSFFYDPYEARYCSTWKTRNRRGRAVGVAVSADGLSWKKLIDGPVFVPDDHDSDTTQVYGMPVFAYQGMYIGMPWIYAARYFRFGEYSVDKLHEAQADSARTIEPQLAWSWDLVNWTRPVQREPLIARGQPGAWDAGMIVTARAPVVVKDELWFYYGGTDKVHDEPRVKAAIGLAKLRLDGFCSMSSRSNVAGEPVEEGWLITRREPLLGPRILINARTGRSGSIAAEILDRRNRVVQGFSRDECLGFSGDSVRYELRWKNDRLPAVQSPIDYKLRFWLKDAELFSYQPLELDVSQSDLARFPKTGP